MGKLDTEGKQYVNSSRIFADAFNYLIYGGEQVIDPTKLRSVDTTEIAIPYGNGARVPIQRYRDTLKIWSAMMDENAIYVLLGAEIQGKVHYAMPVKDMLYDAVNYASQVDEARRSYRSKDDEGEIVINDDALTIKLTQAEFLSGFRKDDKLIPVVTAVIYFGSEEWDGSLSIHEMLKTTDERILRVIPDYRINLISSTAIPDEEFDTKFSTGLGLALHAIKYSKTKAVEILMATNHKMIDRESGVFIREALNIDLEFSEPKEKGVVDVCKAVSDYTLKEKVLAVIDILKDEGHSDEDIIQKIIKKYNVTEKYVRELIAAAA